ncbi:MAG: chemotaxis protein CheW, partial [Candidatus Gastranaerophilales bacterium]|nr:chemotaxis protein CheW [Candidatus Gastranaerophilales bacterium]
MVNNALVEHGEKTFIFFKVGTSVYGIDIVHVFDIMQLVELEYPESMPDYIAGLLEFNNQIIKIAAIRNILRLETSNYALDGKIIIIKTENDIFGLIVEDIIEIRRTNAAAFNTPPYDTEKSYIQAIYAESNFSATILNISNIEKTINSGEYRGKANIKPAAEFLPKDNRSKEILHRRKLHYARKMREVSYEIIRGQDTYVTFFLNKNVCCIKILNVAGFYKFSALKITKVPCTPDFIKGIVSVKGRYITVIDLLNYTEKEKTQITKDTKIIVIAYEDYLLGILADGIGETIEIQENSIKRRPEKSNSCMDE